MKVQAAGKVKGVDGFRGWGVFAIMLFHMSRTFQAKPFFSLTMPLLISLDEMIITAFFAISGFILFRRLVKTSQTERHYRRNFYVRRYFRIIPLWWLLLGALYLTGDFSFKILMLNMSFLFGFVMYNTDFVPIEVSWALFCEEIFYLLLPPLTKTLQKTRVVLWMIVGTIGLAAAWDAIAPMLGVPQRNVFIFHSPPSNFRFFLIGIGLFHVLSKPAGRKMVDGLIGAGPFTLIDFAFIAGCVAKLSGLPFPSELGCALLVLGSLTPQTLIARLLNNRVGEWMGVRVYSFYILHGILLNFLQPLEHWELHFLGVDTASLEVQMLCWLPVFMSILSAVISVTHFLIEMPTNLFGNRLTLKWEKQEAAREGVRLAS